MTSLCSICLELKCPDDFYNYRNKYEKTCKQCKKAVNSTRLLCDCGRYYTRTNFKRHIKTDLPKNGLNLFIY
jgi:hypothetical protein